MRLGSATAFVLALAGLAAGCRGDAVKCDQGCRNYFTLMYWNKADADIARAPADQRDALRKQKLGELNKRMEDGVDMCISQCQAANKPDDIECMITAKTADQARGCVGAEPDKSGQ